jgi:hypothetical protein
MRRPVSVRLHYEHAGTTQPRAESSAELYVRSDVDQIQRLLRHDAAQHQIGVQDFLAPRSAAVIRP